MNQSLQENVINHLWKYSKTIWLSLIRVDLKTMKIQTYIMINLIIGIVPDNVEMAKVMYCFLYMVIVTIAKVAGQSELLPYFHS